MKSIKGYELAKSIIDFGLDNVGFQKAERELDGEEVELLWIQKKDSNASVVKPVFKGLRYHLLNKNIPNIQKIIDINEDEENDVFYIVYESIEGNENGFNKQNFEQSISALDALKKGNLQGFVLNKKTVVKSDNDIQIRFIGLYKLFKKGVLSMDGIGSEKRKMQDDIISIANLFSDYLKDSDIGTKILENCQLAKYSKYSEIIEDINELPNEANPDWSSMQVACNEANIDIDKLINELNSGCWIKTEENLSDREEVQALWSTKRKSGKFYVKIELTDEDEDYGSLFVPHQKDYPNEEVFQNGKRAKLNFENGMHKEECYPIPDFLTPPSVNRLAERNQNKKEYLKLWKTLPENEKKYIEKEAFKAKYESRKYLKENKENIVFQLEESFGDWEKIKNKKNEGVVLSINDSYIGTILDFKTKEKIIVIKDSKKPLDAIPECGELVEDVQQKTSQYKKQIEACEKFSNRDIANPEISAFIATPEEIPQSRHLDIDYDDFEEKIISLQLKEDETQKNAVIEALHRKPIYLIQGPPGTGKTTVIVEMVEQFIRINKSTRILVVSQSNTAVDNVLERLLPKEVKFIRLASEDAVKQEKISTKISNHTFETKLKDWVNETREKSLKYFDEKFSNVDKPLARLYKDFQRKPNISFDEFIDLYQKTGMFKDYYQTTFRQAKDIEQVREVFKEKLGEQYMILQQVHSDWLAFVNNATSKKKGTIKHGSKDIPLDIAFAKSMNVFGSTCIHIASSKYSSIDFKFDVMIMDESSKATDAEALVPINMSKDIILIGDHKQLPPVVTREQEVRKGIKDDMEDEGLDIDKKYGKSMFERLITNFENNHHYALYTMLDIQYRMPRQIGCLISEYIYDGKLKNPSLHKVTDYDKSKEHRIQLKKQFIRHNDENIPNSIIAVSTSHLDNPYDNGNRTKRANMANIDVIKQTLKELSQLCDKDKNIPREIGVIAAYRGQVESLKSSIVKKHYQKLSIDINTVDQFQGSEKDIIIYDVVRSSNGKSNIGFLDDYRRINVAFSRAKKLLIVVGDSEFILKKVQCNPGSNIKAREDLHLVKIFKQLDEWGCIYPSFAEALEND